MSIWRDSPAVSHFHEWLGALRCHRGCMWEFTSLAVEKKQIMRGCAADMRITVSRHAGQCAFN